MRTSPPNAPAIHRRWTRIGSAAAATAALVFAGLGTAAQANAAPAATTAKTTSSKVTWATTPCATPKKKGDLACNSLRVTGGLTAFQKHEAAVDGVTPKAADAPPPPPVTARPTSRTPTA